MVKLCMQGNTSINFYNVSVSSTIDSLAICFQNGSSYGTLNCHKSAIFLIFIQKIDADSREEENSKVFLLYDNMWDPSTV